MNRSGHLAVLLTVVLVAASVAYAANEGGSAQAPRELRFACAAKSNSVMRYVTALSKCRRQRERRVTVSAAAPVVACVQKGKRGRLAAGTLKQRRGRRCARGHRTLTLPGRSVTLLCAARRGGRLRHVTRRRCPRGHFLLVVSPSAPSVNRPPVAADDAAATSEDTATTVTVLSGDSDPDGDPLAVASLDMGGTKGAVTLNPDGTVTFDPAGRFDSLAPGESASDSFRYTASDGSASSNAATVTVTVGGRNEAPVLGGVDAAPVPYTGGDPPVKVAPSITVADADGATVAGATVAIAAGHLPADALGFADQLGITGTYDTGTGVLTLTGTAPLADYETALRSVEFETPLASPTASRTIRFVADDGSSDNAASSPVSAQIGVVHANQAPTAQDDSFSGALGNTKLAVGRSSSGPVVQITGSVLDNDSDPETPDGDLTVSGPTETLKGGELTLESDGTFVYVPPAGFEDGDDAFDYTLHDNDAEGNPRTDTGTANIAVADELIWYVDSSAAPGGDGRSNAPLDTLAPLTGAGDPDDGRDVIFLYEGAYAGGIALETDQSLVGEPEGLTVAGTALVPAAGSNPSVRNGAGDAITLANLADVLRVDVGGGSTSGAGVRGTSVNSATIGPNTSISGSAGSAVVLSGGTGVVSIASNITHSPPTGSSPSIDVQSRTGGAAAHFTGELQLTPRPGGEAFRVASAGTITATDPDNVASASSAVGVRVANTTIGAAGVTFRSVSASGGSNGIVLQNTGAAGSLTVSGAATDHSGGTISGTTGHAILLASTLAPAFNEMNVVTPAHAGVSGTSVNGFTLTNSTVSGAGDAKNDPKDAALAFNSAAQTNLSGAVTITGNTITTPYGGGVDVANLAGTISDLAVTGNTISSSTNPALSNEDGISLALLGTAGSVASLARANISGNSISNFPNGGGIFVAGGNTADGDGPAGSYGTFSPSAPGAGANAITINGNTISGNATNKLNNEGISASVTGHGSGNFAITNNTPLTNIKGAGIAIGAAGDADASFLVTGNSMSPGSIFGSSGIGIGTNVNEQANATVLSDPDLVASVTGNTIQNSDGTGIRVLHRDSNGSANLEIQGNEVGPPMSAPNAGIRIDAGSGGAPPYTPSLCVDIAGNTSDSAADPNKRPGIVLAKQSPAVFGLTGGASPLVNPATAAEAETYTTNLNPDSAFGSGTFAGKRVAVTTGANFTPCTLPFP